MGKKNIDKGGFFDSKEGKAAFWIILIGAVGIILFAVMTMTPVGKQLQAAVFGEPPAKPVRHYSLQRAFEACRQEVYKEAPSMDILRVGLDQRSTRYNEKRVEYLVFLDVQFRDSDVDFWSSCQISADTLAIERFRLRADGTSGLGNVFGF